MTTLARSRWALLAALAALLVLPAFASATTFKPNRTDDPLFGAGECSPAESPPSCSLRGAIEAANEGDTIVLGPGTYGLMFGPLVLEKHLTISGAGPGQTTIEQEIIGSRVIEVMSGVGLDLSGVTVTGGHLIGSSGANGTSGHPAGEAGGSVSGAGILCSGPTTLTDVVVTGNEAFGGDGGKGFSESGALEGGEGGRGGTAFGVGISGSNSLVLTRVAVTNNVGVAGAAGDGGAGGPTGKGGKGGQGGYSSGVGVEVGIGSTLTATDTLVADNRGSSGAGGKGGAGGTSSGVGGAGGQGEPSLGALFSNGVVHLTNVTVSGNVTGGGVAGAGGAARGGNSKGGAGGFAFGASGGGLTLFNGVSATFASVTLAGNEAGAGTSGAGGSGAGSGAKGANGELSPAHGGNLDVYSSTVALRDTIIAQGGSAATGSEDCNLQSATSTSLGHNLFDRKGQCVGAAAAGDKEGVAAGLAALADNGGATATMALQTGSAAIDAGEASCIDAFGGPLKTDQRGLPRGNPCDIGAFEVQPPPPPAPPVSPVTPAKPGVIHGGPKKGGPDLTKLKLTPKRLAPGTAAKIKFKLSAAAAVTFSLQKKAGKKWVKAKGAPKRLKHAVAGPDKRSWKVPGLAPGKYRLGAKPAGGVIRRVAFTVIPAR